MLSWMLYVIMVTLLLSVGAFVAERAARLQRAGTRWIWIAAILASLLIPTVIASVSVQLPNVLSPQVTASNDRVRLKSHRRDEAAVWGLMCLKRDMSSTEDIMYDVLHEGHKPT